MDAPRGSVEFEQADELERLRRRAYGPDADIARDAAAQARLSALEAAQRRQATPVGDAATGVAAPIPERVPVTGTVEGSRSVRQAKRHKPVEGSLGCRTRALGHAQDAGRPTDKHNATIQGRGRPVRSPRRVNPTRLRCATISPRIRAVASSKAVRTSSAVAPSGNPAVAVKRLPNAPTANAIIGRGWSAGLLISTSDHYTATPALVWRFSSPHDDAPRSSLPRKGTRGALSCDETQPVPRTGDRQNDT